jgi:hypothetical protein
LIMLEYNHGSVFSGSARAGRFDPP